MPERNRYGVGILCTHPIQHYIPWCKLLAKNPEIYLPVYFCHRQTPKGQSKAGYGISFEWDIPMLEGYENRFLQNIPKDPNVFNFFGCNTAEIKEIINNSKFGAFIEQGWFNKSFWQAIFACWKSKTPLLVKGNSNLISHGGNISQLSGVMINLASNIENMSRMGKNAFNLIQKYSVQNTADGVVDAIKSVSNINNCLLVLFFEQDK